MTRASLSRSRLGSLMPASSPVSDNQRVANGLMEDPLLSAGDRELVASFVLSHASRFTPWDDRTGSPARDEAARAHNGEGAEFRYMSKFRRRYCSRRPPARRSARGRNVFKLRRRCARMEFWTKAMLGVVAVAVVVVLVGSVYTVGEEADPIECKLVSVLQTDSSSNADDSLLARGEVWAYVTVYVYVDEDMSFSLDDAPALILDGEEYEAVYLKVTDWSDSENHTARYKLVAYYAVSGIYDDGDLVKDVTDYAELTLPDGWALRSS